MNYLRNLLPGYKTYIAAGMGMLTALVDMYNHGPNPNNLMSLTAALGAAGGRALAK